MCYVLDGRVRTHQFGFFSTMPESNVDALRSTDDTFLGSKADAASTSLGTRYHNRVQDMWMYKSPDPYDFMTFSLSNKEIRFYYYYFHFRSFTNVFDILQEPVDMETFFQSSFALRARKNFSH